MTPFLGASVLAGLGVAAGFLAFVGRGRILRAAALAVAAAPLLGAALASLSYFALAAVTDRRPDDRTLAVVVGTLAAAFVLGVRATPGREIVASPRRSDASPRLTAIVLIFTLTGLLIGALLVADVHRRQPRGDWDAQAIWNVRARFLVEAPSEFGARLGLHRIGHPDYPLLLPAALAAAERIDGGKGDAASAPLSFALYAGLLLLLALAAGRRSGMRGRAAAVALLLAAPTALFAARSQLADLPLASSLLLAAGFLTGQFGVAGLRSFTLTGVFLGIAVWTKNEGSLWALLLFLLALVGPLGAGGREVPRWARATWMTLGALPGVLATIVFKVLWAPPNDLLRDGPRTFFAYLTSGERIRDSVRGLVRTIAPPAGCDHFGIVLPIVVLALVLALRRRDESRRIAAFALLWLGSACAAVIFIYTVTPRDQDWHIDSSMPRLVLQVLPIAIVGAVEASVRRSAQDIDPE